MTEPLNPGVRPNTELAPEVINTLLLDTDPYLSCDDCFDQLDRYVEQRLADPDHQDLPMQVHLAGCGACAEEAEALAELLGQDAG